MADIRVIFVIPDGADDESEMSQLMTQTYDSCKQLVNNILWIKEANLSTLTLSKLDYLVFEHFGDRDFSKFMQSKCAVVGPLAISVCLNEGKPIPNFQWPIQTVAMYGCEVTCSQLSKSAKEEIKKKVHLMGGFYTGNFTDSTTHLICDGTTSEKYILAVKKGAKLMLPSWISYLYQESQSNNVIADDPKILEKYKCPALHNLTICSTGIRSSKERMELGEIIAANGGTLSLKLVLNKTDVLVCEGPGGTTSDKFKAARNTSHIVCVTINWVLDSIKNGYALPHENYRVKTVTSTPTKDGENIDPNFSTISAIGGSLNLRKSNLTSVNETVNVTNLGNEDRGTTPVFKKVSSKRKADNDLVEKIDIKKVKSAGNFLDGCSIFVAGFSPTQRDKLNKIINISGATRYDYFSERVSHVIVGDSSCPEITALKSKGVQCCLVSVQWLLSSVDQQKPADEANYFIGGDTDADNSTMCSPLSKKVINFLRQDSIISNEDKEQLKEIDFPEDALTQKYMNGTSTTTNKNEEDTLAKLLGDQNTLTSKTNEGDFCIKTRLAGGKKVEEDKQIITSKKANTASKTNEDEYSMKTRLLGNKKVVENDQTMEFRPANTSTQISEATTDTSNISNVLPIFRSVKFILDGFDEERHQIYTGGIVDAGGHIIDKRFKGVCEYAVCPIIYKPAKLAPHQELVNEIWLRDCLENSYLCTEIQYYHRPIDIPPTNPLQGCVIGISTYTGEEREFLKTVIEGLGGIFQEVFSRKNREAKNVLASTHLVIPEPTGKKYEAALKWEIPVATKDWLLECAKTGRKVPVEDFMVKEISAENSTISNAEKSTISNAETSKNSTTTTTKENMTNNKVMQKPSDEKTNLSTPKTNKILANEEISTPVNQIYNFNQKNTPEPCSQVTPINKILQDAINNKVLPTPPSPKTYFPWDPKTPDTPIGAFIRPNPSPRLRKEMQKYVNSFPEFVPPKRRISTPLSELKKRLMDKVLGRGEYSQGGQDDISTQELAQQICEEETRDKEAAVGNVSENTRNEPSAEDIAVHQKLQELQQRVMASGSSSATRRSSRMFESSNLPGIEKTNNAEVQSQICTVGWDYGEEKTQTHQQRVFMLSGVENSQREKLADDLKTLGALVSETSSYDPTCTHLICPKPGRNEKTLACMAAGKWILHVSYIEKSVAAGHFLDEEQFEFGNPQAKKNIFYEEKDSSISFWRKEIRRRGYGAFNDMRAIIIAEKKEPITNVIEAGGGVVVNVIPPFEDSIHATHCLLEIKMVKDFSKYVVLAQQGIKCVNTIYINDFLCRNKKDDNDYIIPYFSKYFK